MDTSLLSSVPPIILITIGIGILSIVLLVWVIRLELKWRALLRGSKSGNLEAAIRDVHAAVSKLEKEQTTASEHLQNIETRLPTSIRAVETVRFNPFRGDGSGGNQSFATALLDERGNGVVLLGLYARERVSIYAKPVAEFVSPLELSDEERQAVTQARAALA